MENVLFRNCKFEIYPDPDEKLREIITDELGFKISRHRPLTIEKENAKQQDIQKLIITLNKHFKRKECENSSLGHQEDNNQISEPTSSSEGIVTSDPGTSNIRTLSAESNTFLNGSHGPRNGKRNKIGGAKKSGARDNLKCQKCGKTLSNKQIFVGHMNLHNGIKPYSCRYCKKLFSYSHSANIHEKKTCKYKNCTEEAGSQGNQANHDRRNQQHHEQGTGGGNKNLSGGAKKSGARQSLKCPKCPKTLSCKENFKSHMNLHKGIKPYSCFYCNKAFSYRQSANKHGKTCKYKRA